MDLTIYDVIKKSRTTSKTVRLNSSLSQVVVEVHPQANKPMIREALKKLFGLDAKGVRVVVMKGKNRRIGRRAFKAIDRKKAIVTLRNPEALRASDLGSTIETPPAQ